MVIQDCLLLTWKHYNWLLMNQEVRKGLFRWQGFITCFDLSQEPTCKCDCKKDSTYLSNAFLVLVFQRNHRTLGCRALQYSECSLSSLDYKSLFRYHTAENFCTPAMDSRSYSFVLMDLRSRSSVSPPIFNPQYSATQACLRKIWS